MEPLTSFVMLAGLNAIGMVAISVGGLGIAEVGSAGILAVLGTPLDQAAHLSLIARPVLLFSMLSACVVLWFGLWAWARTRNLEKSGVSQYSR